MIFRTLLFAVLLAGAPVAALAQACSPDHARMSCADGTVWDDVSGSCVSASS